MLCVCRGYSGFSLNCIGQMLGVNPSYGNGMVTPTILAKWLFYGHCQSKILTVIEMV